MEISYIPSINVQPPLSWKKSRESEKIKREWKNVTHLIVVNEISD